MTVPSTRFREDYAGNGSATSFPYAFRIFKAADLVVTKTDSSGNDTTLTLGTHYTVTGAGSYNGGAVVLTTALPTSYRLTIERVLAIRQDTDLRNQGEFLAETHEDAFDRLTMIVQRLAGYLGMGQDGTLRTLLLGTSDTDGAGAFRARGNRISGLGDPIDDTDAVGKRWTQEQIASAVNVDGSSMQGVFSIAIDTIVGASGLLWPDKATVIARGRDTVGDGGGGPLRFLKGSTATADGVTIYAVTGGRLVREGWSVFGINVQWAGAKGDRINDDTAAIRLAWSAVPVGGKLIFPQALGYKITDTIQFFDKGRVTIEFNNQLIDATSFDTLKDALQFKGISQSKIGDIFIIGNTDYVNRGVLFDADADSITIHVTIGKVHASNCNIGILVGNPDGYQLSDSTIADLYGADCNIGVFLTGENTLAMTYGRIAAYNNNNYGVIFEQGGGTVGSLQVADSGIDIYFGSTAGTNHNKLNRWDILGGYSEEGANGEVFIGSTACSDGKYFKEQIVINGFRCTPFTSTNVQDFIKWNLNGDLILRNFTFNHGTQLPRIKVDSNAAYRAPRVLVEDGVIGANPPGAPEVPMLFQTTSSKQRVELNCRANNAITFWQNNGAANEGTLKRGIYMSKLYRFEQSLLSIAGLAGAWHLRDITSGVCENLVLGKPSLTASATIERRDVWLDDGLIGFYRNATTSKTLSTSSSTYSAGDYTFGCFLRTPISGVDETDYTALGGAGGINVAIGDTGGAFVRCTVGAFNCQGTPTNPLDPHLVIGRFVPGTSVKMDAINLRTGEIIRATVGSGPALVDLTWTNGVSIRNDNSVRGMPFVYSRALTDNEVSSLLQASLQLTESWRS